MLAISTVTKKAYIAVEYNDKEYFSEIDADCSQSEKIMTEIDLILQKNSISFKDIGNIAVLVGPGSFTGIRIGIALVKGLCAGDESHKVIPITTLDLMAKAYIKDYLEKENKELDDDFTCVINALSGRYFVASYSKNGKKIVDEKMVFQDELKQYKNLVVLEEEISILPGVSFTSKLLLEYAKQLEKEGNLLSAEQINPLYIRKAQAEENLN